MAVRTRVPADVASRADEAPVAASLRPELIRFDATTAGTDLTSVAGTVADVQFFGGTSHVLVDVDGFDRPIVATSVGPTPRRARRRGGVVVVGRPTSSSSTATSRHRRVSFPSSAEQGAMSSSTITRILVDPASGVPIGEVADTSLADARPCRHAQRSRAANVGDRAARAALAGAAPPGRPRRARSRRASRAWRSPRRASRGP